MLLYRRGLYVECEKLRYSMKQCLCIKVMEIGFISLASKLTHSEKPVWWRFVQLSSTVHTFEA